MMRSKHMFDDELGQIASMVLEHAPAESIPAPIALSLQTPTYSALEAAANALLAGRHLDQAETVFRILKGQPEFEVRASAALARIVSLRGDAARSAIAWRDCLDRFQDRAEAYWFVELARAERQLSHYAEAENTLRQCIESFPNFGTAAINLAELLSTRGRPEEAAALCQAAISNFSDQAQPWWFKTLVSALQATGNTVQLEQVLREMALRFPEAQATLVLRAQNAARNEDWCQALALWTKSLERYADSTQPEWLNGRAMALYRLFRVEEAMDAWRELIKRFPDFINAYSEMAGAAETIGQRATVQQLVSEMVARFPERVRPEWFARRARCLFNPRPVPAIHDAIAELESRFPDSPLGRKIAIDLANWMQYGVKALDPLIADAVRRFPDDRPLMADHVHILLASGRLDEAESIVQRLEAGQDDHLALISRWRITIDRDGVESIKESASRAAMRGSWPLETGLAIGVFLLNVWTAWAAGLALAVYESLDNRFPGRLAVICAKARTLVVLRQDQAALGLIDSVPSAYQDRTMLELRAWTCAKRGDNETAREHWETILAHYYFPAVHAVEPNLELLTPERVGLLTEGVAVIFAVRNEMVNLGSFLRHYRKLGVGRFVAVDNLSTDGSEEFLRAQSDVILYRTGDDCSAANFGMRWINALIERHAAGGWCLFADADEAFIYPGWESTPVSKLIEYLDREGAEAVAAFMLDVYPERLIDPAGVPATHADAQYYDGDYEWIGHVRTPYLRPAGGIRARLFGSREYLHKIPLIKSSRGVHVGNHETTALKLSGVTGALLHYKLTSLANNRTRIPWPEGVCIEVMRRYEVYSSHLDELSHVDLRRPGVTQALTDSFTLSDRGLMRAPKEYKTWFRKRRMAQFPKPDIRK